MPSNSSISVDKQNEIDRLASQSPLFVVKTDSNAEFESHHYDNSRMC